MTSQLHNNDIKIYSTYNKGKSAVAERFIRTFKNKIYRHITAVIKKMYIDELDEIVDNYNKTYQKTKEKNKK